MTEWEPSWIAVSTVITIHKEQIQLYGGDSGLRDQSLLESAVARAKQIFTYEIPPASLERLAAAYGYGIAKNHAFVDGNKRTAAVVAVTFLQANQYTIEASDEDFYEIFNRVAGGEADEETVVAWFEERAISIATWR